MPSLQSQVSMRHTEKCCIKTTHVRALNAAVHRQGGYLPVTENQKAHVSDLSNSCHQHHCISWKKHLKSCTLTNYSLSYGMIFLTNCMKNLVTKLQYETKKNGTNKSVQCKNVVRIWWCFHYFCSDFGVLQIDQKCMVGYDLFLNKRNL